jgi:hypothetical protein
MVEMKVLPLGNGPGAKNAITPTPILREAWIRRSRRDVMRYFAPLCPSWVIFDRFSRCCLPVHVRFAPKATGVLHCRNMTLCAINGSEQVQQFSTLHRPYRP